MCFSSQISFFPRKNVENGYDSKIMQNNRKMKSKCIYPHQNWLYDNKMWAIDLFSIRRYVAIILE